MIELYHQDVYMPVAKLVAALPADDMRLGYSLHARQAALDEVRRGASLSNIPKVLETFHRRLGCVIEAEFDDDRLIKIVVRLPMNPRRDLVLVLLAPVVPGHSQKWLVKTLWTNEVNDDHNTLDRSRYATK